MHEDSFRAIEAGATVVTASRRLARVLRQEFDFRQKGLARSVWKTPDILPLDAFLGRAWRDLTLSGLQPNAPALLDPVQEQFVWEQAIRESPEGESLLRIPETARQAMEAWQVMVAYRLPVDGRFQAGDDWSAFAAWSRAFQERCQANNWLERSRLSDFVIEMMRSGETARQSALYRAGFDELTPQQEEFFEVTGEWREVEIAGFKPELTRWKFRDATEEIRAAASWARLQLEQNPHAQIGVIVPNLKALRSKVERTFREILHPGVEFDQRERSFHLSLGPTLDQYPLVHAALLMLEFAVGPLTLPRAGMLLRSPFVGGAETELTKRALLDAKLRKKGVWDVTTSSLRDAAGNCPLLQRALRRFEKHLDKLPAEQHPSLWSRDFSKLLDAFGWPGDRVLNSREHQVLEAWLALLSSFATLDVAALPVRFAHALSRLREIAAATPFQVENDGAPVQIMGLLEASGLRFDCLWIMGLHDEALPPAAGPNPFIPISLQREYRLPHASPERELAFAGKLIDRLLINAPDIVLSYPETEGDRVLAPSPLVTGGAWQVPDAGQRPSDWIARMRAGVAMERLTDEIAPVVAADIMQPGGASLFKDMAACPFRAFAKHRLGARPLEETDLGLNYKDRGSTVHKALELIWTELGSHTQLMQLTAGELDGLIARNVDTALNLLGVGIGRKVEQRRLQNLLSQWLEIEKSRTPFTVVKPEEERLVTVGGLQIRTRVDRIDALNTGGEIILDYKTGQVKSAGWDTERPDEPQLPLYCATSARPISGAAFAVIRTGELAFRGLTDTVAALPGLKKMSSQAGSFAEQVAEWRIILERLAAEYRNGLAIVDPKPDACEHCGLTALCRIRESENDRG
jgi:ATP-dependent helicase/nuclease subunit B